MAEDVGVVPAVGAANDGLVARATLLGGLAAALAADGDAEKKPFFKPISKLLEEIVDGVEVEEMVGDEDESNGDG